MQLAFVKNELQIDLFVLKIFSNTVHYINARDCFLLKIYFSSSSKTLVSLHLHFKNQRVLLFGFALAMV